MLTFARETSQSPVCRPVSSGGGSLGGFVRNPSPSWDVQSICCEWDRIYFFGYWKILLVFPDGVWLLLYHCCCQIGFPKWYLKRSFLDPRQRVHFCVTILCFKFRGGGPKDYWGPPYLSWGEGVFIAVVFTMVTATILCFPSPSAAGSKLSECCSGWSRRPLNAKYVNKCGLRNFEILWKAFCFLAFKKNHRKIFLKSDA